MEGIYETNETFDFNKLTLLSPTICPGGNYFIKFRINDSPLYIQPPKCKTKQGILKTNKKYYCDLLFTNEDEKFLNWITRLENHCRKIIYENRNHWFDVELDEHDIENSFSSTLKTFKLGKQFISRTNVPTTLGLCSLKIYNEKEEEIALEEIKENTDVMTILEIQGIKCSVKHFQIEIEIKQMMVIEAKKLFEKCIFRKKNNEESNKPSEELQHNQTLSTPSSSLEIHQSSSSLRDSVVLQSITALEEGRTKEISEKKVSQIKTDNLESVSNESSNNYKINSSPLEIGEQQNPKETKLFPSEGGLDTKPQSLQGFDNRIQAPEPNPWSLGDSFKEKQDNTNYTFDTQKKTITNDDVTIKKDDHIENFNKINNENVIPYEKEKTENKESEIFEFDFDLNKLSGNEVVKIKKKNEIYFELYREAKRKAKIARDLALSSYLEAKHIKNTYLLEDFTDDSDDDFEE